MLSVIKTSRQGVIKLALASLALLMTVSGLNLTIIPSALAATVPDSCFVFSSGTITGYDPASDPSCLKDLTIPSTIGGVTVTAIADNAFAGYGLTSLSLPNSLLSIGNYAFVANSISSLSLGNSLTTIGNGAFQSNLISTLTIPDSVQSIGDMAFMLNQLTSVTIGNGIKTIGTSAFMNNQISSLSLGSKVATIKSQAFMYNKLTNITLPQSVTTIGYGAFAQNQLGPLTIPAGATSIDGAFFSNNITTVLINGQTNFTDSGSNDTFNVNADNTGQYVRILTADPTNPYGYVDYNYTTSGGAYLINPASITVKYVDSHGNVLTPGYTKTGDTLTDYTVAANPTADFSLYYRAGKIMTLTAPTVSGYVTPLAQTVTLKPGDNSVTFTYFTAAELAAKTPKVPDTGFGVASHNPLVVEIGLILSGMILAVVARRLSMARARR